MEAFHDIRVEKFSSHEGLVAALKWTVYAEWMVFKLDFVTTERARQELVSR